MRTGWMLNVVQTHAYIKQMHAACVERLQRQRNSRIESDRSSSASPLHPPRSWRFVDHRECVGGWILTHWGSQLSVWTWSLFIYIDRWAMKEFLVVTQPVYFKGSIYWKPAVRRVTVSVDECCHVNQHVWHFNWRSARHIKDGHVWKWQKVGRAPCLHFVPQSGMLILWTVAVLGAADAFSVTMFLETLSGLIVLT